MNLLVLSDFHLCNGDKFGTFGWKSREFKKILKRLVKHYNIEQIILNGDIFELYKYNYSDIAAEYPKLIKFINKKKLFIYIRGNHDWVCDYGLENYTIENSKMEKIYFEHGHEADLWNGTLPGRVIGRLLFRFLKILVNINFFRSIYLRIVEIDAEINHIPRRYNSWRYLQYALNLLKKYDMVVLGHTHKIETHECRYLGKKKVYLNSGACTLGKFEGLFIDSETLKYEIIKLK
ncbi:MAG TPA: hypothetical protein DC049_19835 [Spirochaetia bacterium]|nr:hypothetical protein [Spirochaetia bacterium]